MSSHEEDRVTIAASRVTGCGTAVDPYVISDVVYDKHTEGDDRELAARLAAVVRELNVIPFDLLDGLDGALMVGDVLLPNSTMPAHLEPGPGYDRHIRQVRAFYPATSPTLHDAVEVVASDGREGRLVTVHADWVVRMPGMGLGTLLSMVTRLWTGVE